MVYATDSRIVPLRMGCILVCTRYLLLNIMLKYTWFGCIVWVVLGVGHWVQG